MRRSPVDKRSPLLALVGLVVVGIFGQSSVVNGQAYTGRPRTLADDVGLDQKLNDRIDLDLEFRDEQGKQVRLGDYFGNKPVIINCVYYRCPMLCTEVLNGVLKTANAMNLKLGEDYVVLSISIDPEETTERAAAKKETYVGSYRRPGGERGWHFLTGQAAAITAVTKLIGYRYRYDPKSNEYAHPSGIVVCTPEGVISHYLYGIDYPPRDLRLALVESSQGRIGNAVDQILLLCFHYDPVTGKYGVLISRILRAAGMLTLGVLAVFLGRMFWLERRRSLEAAQALPAGRSV